MMRRCFAGLVLLALALAFGNVRAAPLDAATCGMLKGEQVQLEQTGVRGNMAKGPDWAKANLAPEKLDQIRRILQLDEQLLFRCSSRTLVELPPDADADPAAKAPEKKDGEDADKDGAASKDDSPAAAKKKVSPAGKKAAPSKKAAASPGDDAATPGTPKAAGTAGPAPKKQALPKDPGKAPAPKAKPKQDDAYKPPPPNPAVDPFANQPRL